MTGGPFPSEVFPGWLIPAGGEAEVPGASIGDQTLQYMSLVEIDFDSGTRYYSFEGISSPSQWYKDQVVEIGTINRDVPALAGEYRVAECNVVLSNVDLEFSTLKATQPFRNRTVRIKFGNRAEGLSAMTTLYTGAISDWSFSGGKLNLTVRDVSFDPLRTSLGGYINQTDFSTAPASEEPRFWPIIYGEVSSVGHSATGAVPCYLTTSANPFKYLVARHICKSIDNVYLYGVLVDPGDYTTSTAEVSGQTMQFIEFTTDQRDTNRPNEIEITADVKGITDDGLSTGTLIENPAEQLEHYLVNYAGIASADIDASFGYTATYLDSKLYEGSVAILDNRPHSEVLERFMESFGLSFYCTREGTYGLFVFDVSQLNDIEALEPLTDDQDILRDSFQIYSQEQVCSRMQFNYVYNWPKDYFEYQPDQIDDAEIENLGADIRENLNLWYVRDDATALDVVTERMGLMRENAQFAAFDLPIQQYNLDLNDLVRISHWQGISEDGLGYQEFVFRILQLGINLQPSSMRVSAYGIRPVLVGNIWLTYFKLGNESELASTWSTASDADRLYGYLGDETDTTGSAKGTLGTDDPIKLLF